jgi:hypothetical protein
MSLTTPQAFGPQTRVSHFQSTQLTIHSAKRYRDVVSAIESRLQRFDTARATEYIVHRDRRGFENDVASTCTPFGIFWEVEQGTAMRMSGVLCDSKLYLVGNPVLARHLFSYNAGAGLGAPVRVSVSQADGLDTRIDLELPSAFFSRFPELAGSPVPAQLDNETVSFFEQIAVE